MGVDTGKHHLLSPGHFFFCVKLFTVTSRCCNYNSQQLYIGTNSQTCSLTISFITCVGLSPRSSTDLGHLTSVEEHISIIAYDSEKSFVHTPTDKLYSITKLSQFQMSMSRQVQI
jgi:hypothetical protein